MKKYTQDPTNFRFWLLKGWLAKGSKDAERFFEQAIKVGPEDKTFSRDLKWYFNLLREKDYSSGLSSSKYEGQFSNTSIHAQLSTTTGKDFENRNEYDRSLKRQRDRYLLNVIIYILIITAAEFLATSLYGFGYGLIFHGLILTALLLQSALSARQAEQRLYLTLLLAPLIRLVSLSLPLQNFPLVFWYLVIGVPIFISIFIIIRYTGLSPKEIGLTAPNLLFECLFGLAGVGFGYLEYLILQPKSLIHEITTLEFIIAAFILLIFTGLLEEIIFRGLMQNAFSKALGKGAGIIFVSIIFAVMHIGYQSTLDFLFVLGVALLFGLVRLYTGSILGVSLAHGITNIFLYLVFPFILK